MSNDELNKKIAEWLGFKLAKAPSDDGFYYFTIDGMGHPANFTYSLDACFEYIVPKLDNSYDIYVSRHYDRPGFSCAIQNITLSGYKPIFTTAETPALAFCLAVEKLIDASH